MYVGDSRTQSVVGKEDGKIKQVHASDPEFDNMTCTDDFQGLTEKYDDLISKCEKWK